MTPAPGSTASPQGNLTAARPRPFRLMRHFSLASLLGMALVTAALIWIIGASMQARMVEHESRANSHLADLFANAVWSRYRDFVLASRGSTAEALRSHPAQAELDRDVRRKMSGLRVAKVKVYNLQGLTVFSTDPRQIGENRSANPAFARALAGEVTSAVTFREHFDAIEGVVNNRSLVTSYLPVRGDNGAIEGVFEVYSDVTPLQQAQREALWRMAAAVLAGLGTLYLFLHTVVRKADRIISAQARERDTQEAEARHQARHDVLTGLPNRASFADRLAEALAQSVRHGRTGALMFIDLDRFKLVNDSLGHAAGDALLEEVAQRIAAELRRGEALFRMGGDEFTVILPEIVDASDAAHAAQRVVQRLAESFMILGQDVRIGASVGITVFPADGTVAETLLRNADAAMYSAKQAGRGTHSFYRSEMNQRAQQRLTLEAELQRGFGDGEFVLHYQPRVAHDSRAVIALEALLRWRSPTRGLVAPEAFIGVLEEMGMMPAVGEWVLRSACTQFVRWQRAGHDPGRVSVNVSAAQFRAAGFAATVERVLRETGVAARCVELELTESGLIHDVEAAARTVGTLRTHGIRILIDHFGTGYSSLAYLRRFAVDGLKIDRSFVAGIAHSARDRAVARAICELARSLDISVIAEGVETESQARFFAALHCTELQGFLFARPAAVGEIEWLFDAPPAPAGDAVPVVAASGALQSLESLLEAEP